MVNAQSVLDKIIDEKEKLQEELRELPKGTGKMEVVLRRIRIREQLSFIEKLLRD